VKIPLDRNSAQAVYLQIRDRLSRLIESGALQPGDRLPSIRTLAKTTNVNKLTVIEAYSVLEADGLIHARQGSGYFVSPSSPTPPQPASHFAPPQEVILSEYPGNSFFDFYMAAVTAHRHADMVDLSTGFPMNSGLENLQRIARRAVKHVDSTLFNYDLPHGQLILRQQIARMLVQQGLEITPEDLIITNGSKQGLSLALQYHVRPGDWVIVESPTYHGALEILSSLKAKVIGIPMNSEGINLALLEKYLHTYHPKLIYTVSTLQNPTGVTTSYAHRTSLLQLAEKYGCKIIEDNAYEGLAFESVPPPLKALDHNDIVTYLGTFSKTLMPGIRVGYMVATGQDYQPLVESKLNHDYHVSTVSQAIVSEYLATGHYRHHLTHLQSKHLQSRNAMLSALERYFPAEASWTVPNGGTFLWVQLPENISTPAICQAALSHNILIANGALFFPDSQGYNALRLNFSHKPEVIDRVISVLGRLLKDAQKQSHLQQSHLQRSLEVQVSKSDGTQVTCKDTIPKPLPGLRN
jgi:DNA-binding transcriptional MocR family regulator